MGSVFSSAQQPEPLDFKYLPAPPPGPSCWRPPSDEYTRRTSCYSLDGYLIHGYPSKGPKGEARKNSIIAKGGADIVDLRFLGFDRFAPPKERLQSQAAEDRFCRLLLKLGARHWRSHLAIFNAMDPMSEEYDDEIKWFFAWPGIDEHPSARNLESDEYREVVEKGGVWALEMIPEKVFEAGKLRMCLTMEEKVEVLKESGAVFYPDPRDCPPLAGLYPEHNPSLEPSVEQAVNM
ncbi:hypothetical protein MGYG_04332 [Nannizzia gypsea CBS 118893]|uniref:Uncharacterized protein n=1 Tax=Arthroderma gypseum (strain ATCC MYA-4604 / CBS 118893) TaxID=535722 RepID=E4USC1_ARTGP|nr:hypothetical protein MGYG_04332 [Nannizzia gypsea CBS 118893]EFR01325.1 hypothetical protein MGYG_04332 [Nannizzia gypsea CBS 118893]